MAADESQIYRKIPRVPPDVVASLQEWSVADLHDALGPIARTAGLLSSSIRPITSGLRAAGQAITAYCAPGDSLMGHCALYLARPGDVVVLTNGGLPHGAVWGGNMAFDAKARGVAGVVIDGPVRDVASIRRLQVPTWSSSISLARTQKEGHGYVNMPVSCGGSMVNPGDIVVADDDGVLVFPIEYIPDVVDQVRRRVHDESAMHRRIESGERLFDIQNFGKLLEAHGLAIEDGHWSRERGSGQAGI